MFDWLKQPEVLTPVVFLFGLCIGSFLNVVIYRLPKILEQQWRAQCAELQGQTVPAGAPYNLVVPRSQCPACGHPISALENIPLLSFLFLRGRCAACRSKISLRYPIIELLSGVLFAYAAWRFGWSWITLAVVFYLAVLLALCFIDIDTQLLPDNLTLLLLWAGLTVNLFHGLTSLSSAVWGAIAGYAVLWLVYWAFKLLTGKEGMGYGDFKLLAALGAWLGWEMLPLIILFSSLVGAVIGIVIIFLRNQGKSIPIPFGPYLAAAGVLALFWGKPLMAYYLNF